MVPMLGELNYFRVQVSGLSIRTLSKTHGSYSKVQVLVLEEMDSFGVRVSGLLIRHLSKTHGSFFEV